jgi:hypothetical protein
MNMLKTNTLERSLETELTVSPTATPSSVEANTRASNGGSVANKLKSASEAAHSAQAAKKQAAAPAGKREQATYELTRPPRGKFVRVHPSNAYRIYNIPVLEDSDTEEMYFVTRVQISGMG